MSKSLTDEVVAAIQRQTTLSAQFFYLGVFWILSVLKTPSETKIVYWGALGPISGMPRGEIVGPKPDESRGKMTFQIHRYPSPTRLLFSTRHLPPRSLRQLFENTDGATRRGSAARPRFRFQADPPASVSDSLCPNRCAFFSGCSSGRYIL
jgi:hypothetical protein